MKHRHRPIVLAALGTTICLSAGSAWGQATTPPDLIPQPVNEPHVDSGSTAWMLTSTALVLLMVPGLAMFYGGLVRSKNVLGTMKTESPSR